MPYLLYDILYITFELPRLIVSELEPILLEVIKWTHEVRQNPESFCIYYGFVKL